MVVGFGVAVLTQMLVFPLFGLRTTGREDLAIGAIFTVVSLARSYGLRRVFEAISKRTKEALSVARSCDNAKGCDIPPSGHLL